MTKVLPQWSSCKAIRIHIIECAPPFIFIGFSVGILNYIFSTTLFPPVLLYFTNGLFPIRKYLLDVLSEHVAPKSLAYGLLSTFTLASLVRIFFGSASMNTEKLSNFLILPFFKFNLNLAAAMASLIIGLSASAFIVGDFLVSLKFLAFALIPIACIVVLAACTRLSFPLGYGPPNFDDDPIVSRLVGLCLLFAFIIVLLIWLYIKRVLPYVLEAIKQGF